MPSYRIDLHTHSHFSGDGLSRPEQMIEQARLRGLDGFALTDHNTSQGCRAFEALGAMDAGGRAGGGVLVLPGQEVSTREGHVLVVGLCLDSMTGIESQELVDLVRREGGITIAAHPFDQTRSGVGRRTLEAVPFDAIEVFNAACWGRGPNRKARAFAEESGAVMTAGSDAHHPRAIGCSHQIIEAEALTVGSLLAGLLMNESRRVERRMSIQDYTVKSFGSLLRTAPQERIEAEHGGDG